MIAKTPVPITLTGRHIRLEPLSSGHLSDLFEAGGHDDEVWRWLPAPTPRSEAELAVALDGRIAASERGESVAFAVVTLHDGRAVGWTTYNQIHALDEWLEIGWTWYGRASWRTAVNTEAKLLLLAHAFEELGMGRVMLKTDGLNERSQQAIRRLGARYEGVHRREKRRQDGTFRDSQYFAMLAGEWPAAREHLLARLGAHEPQSTDLAVPASRRQVEAVQQTLAVDGEKIACGVLLPVGEAAGRTAVLLHGAGTADRSVHGDLARLLAERGCRVVTLDFSGHGASSGRLQKLSLARRLRQARSVIDELAPETDQLLLVGASMSGQTVADLLGHYGSRVAALGLLAPAVYPRRAWDLAFDAGFTEVIRTPDAWRDSAALEIYAAFTGRAVLAVPAEDHVIPPAVNQALVQALARRADFTHLVFPDATHHLGRYFRSHPRECAQVADLLVGA